MFFDSKPVGHPGNIIANGPFQPTDGGQLLERRGQDGSLIAVGVKQIGNDALGLDLHAYNPKMPVEVAVKKILQFPVAALHVLAVADDVVLQLLDILRRLRLAVLQASIGGMDDVGNEQTHQVTDHAVAFHVVEGGTAPVERLLEDLPQGDSIQHVGGDHARA